MVRSLGERDIRFLLNMNHQLKHLNTPLLVNSVNTLLSKVNNIDTLLSLVNTVNTLL